MVVLVIVLVGSACLLVGLGYLEGRVPGKSAEGLPAALQRTVVQPPIAITIALLLIVLIAWCVRRVLLEWRVWSPGPILVRELKVASNLEGVDPERLTAIFRERLMKARLQSPTTVPGATPPQDFLELLNGAQQESRNLLATLLNILRAATPTHAYEVQVGLVSKPLDGDEPSSFACGAAAQLTRLPGEAIPVQTCWTSSWKDSVEQAADEVTAVVLPRTRLSRSGPWAGWRRYDMPPRLVPFYECAQVLTAKRRYDEALNCYFSALELDPKNVAIRLNIGFVQEKLGLFLDAVATYIGAWRIAELTDPSLYPRRARRERRALKLIARYRLAVLIAGRQVAHQWRNVSNGGLATDRDEHRAALRQRLTPELLRMLRDAPPLRKPPTGTDIGRSVRSREQPLHRLPAGRASSLDPADERAVSSILERQTPSHGPERAREELEIRRVLAHLALQELRVVHRRLTPRNAIGTSPTRITVSLASQLVRMRIAWIDSQLHESSFTARPSEAIRQASRRLWLGRERKFRTWAEHYNAACIYAVPLLTAALDRAQVEQFADQAIHRLKLAVSCTFSGDVAERRAWLVSEDPDLDGLRRCREFRRFEAVYFPSAERTPARLERLHEWDMSCYTHELLRQTARRWHMVWHARRGARTGPVTLETAQDWFADERRTWELVDRVAKHHRHWPARYELIEAMGYLAAKYRFERLQIGVVSHVTKTRFDSSGHTGHDLTPLIESLIRADRRRLERLHGELDLDVVSDEPSPPPPTLRESVARWHSELGDLYSVNRELSPLSLSALCNAHAVLWQRLSEWLDQAPSSAGQEVGKFESALTEAVILWRSPPLRVEDVPQGR